MDQPSHDERWKNSYLTSHAPSYSYFLSHSIFQQLTCQRILGTKSLALVNRFVFISCPLISLNQALSYISKATVIILGSKDIGYLQCFFHLIFWKWWYSFGKGIPRVLSIDAFLQGFNIGCLKEMHSLSHWFEKVTIVHRLAKGIIICVFFLYYDLSSVVILGFFIAINH